MIKYNTIENLQNFAEKSFYVEAKKVFWKQLIPYLIMLLLSIILFVTTVPILIGIGFGLLLISTALFAYKFTVIPKVHFGAEIGPGGRTGRIYLEGWILPAPWCSVDIKPGKSRVLNIPPKRYPLASAKKNLGINVFVIADVSQEIRTYNPNTEEDVKMDDIDIVIEGGITNALETEFGNPETTIFEVVSNRKALAPRVSETAEKIVNRGLSDGEYGSDYRRIGIFGEEVVFDNPIRLDSINEEAIAYRFKEIVEQDTDLIKAGSVEKLAEKFSKVFGGTPNDVRDLIQRYTTDPNWNEKIHTINGGEAFTSTIMQVLGALTSQS